MKPPFVSRPEFWQKTLDDGAGLRVAVAQMNRPDGLVEEGVVVFCGTWPRLVLRIEDAWKLSELLADYLDEQAAS